MWYSGSSILTSDNRFVDKWYEFRLHEDNTVQAMDRGTVSINFTSRTTGRLTLPNGRVLDIEKFDF